MDVLDSDRKVAEELALEVRTASGGPRTWRRVASLLEAFGVERLSDDVRERIATALAGASLEVHPALERAAPDEVVRLSFPDTTELWELAAGTGPRPIITGTEWGPRASASDLDLEQPRTPGHTAWFDLDSSRVVPAEALDELWPFCEGELTLEMLEDLCDPEMRTGVRRYGDSEVRLVSSFAVSVYEPDAEAAGRAGTLGYDPVAVLCGSDWMISCRHGAVVGSTASAQRRLAHLEQAPRPGDLGVNLLYDLACGYPPAERRLRAWLDAWETEFHARLSGEGALRNLEKVTLIDLRGLLADLRSRLLALGQPGIEVQDAWFSGPLDPGTPLRLSELLQAALADLRELADALRTSLDLLATSSAAEQSAAAQAQAEQSARLERQVALIASVLLVPGFLAELTGTKLFPGGDGTWLAFAGLIALMVVMGALTYRLLTRGRPG